MLRLLRTALGFFGAVVLLGGLGVLAMYMARSTPTISVAWYFGAAGIIYTMLILLCLHRLR